MKTHRVPQAALLLILMVGVAVAGPPAADPGPTAELPGPAPVIARVSEKPVRFTDLQAPRQFTTHHTTKIRGRTLSYTATAGETYITNAAGEPIASFFSFSYFKDAPVDPLRPVMFVFNGGPGSSSMWLHIGVLGPKRVVLDHEVNPSNSPPFGLRDNPYSVLDVADLVFIDPVGTGFSHALGNASDFDFASVDADADSVARFIERWLTQNGRWNSPKYVVGESYGSVRAAVLSRALIGGPFYTSYMRGITLDGIVLLGVSLDGGAKASSRASDESDAASASRALPSLAVTAWYHGRIDRADRTVPQLYAEVKAFGAGEYADALRRLSIGALPDEEQQRLAAKLEGYTGLPKETWLRSGLRIPEASFAKQLLAAQGLEVGMYDSRYTLPLSGSDGDPVADDPAMVRYVPGFIAAFHQLLRDDLKVEMPIPYAAIAFSFALRWNFTRTGVPDEQTYAGDLATSMRRMPKLRLLVCAGYFDMFSTPANAEYSVRRAGLPADRITLRNYESGHMLYLGDTAERFSEDVRALVTGVR